MTGLILRMTVNTHELTLLTSVLPGHRIRFICPAVFGEDTRIEYAELTEVHYPYTDPR